MPRSFGPQSDIQQSPPQNKKRRPHKLVSIARVIRKTSNPIYTFSTFACLTVLKLPSWTLCLLSISPGTSSTQTAWQLNIPTDTYKYGKDKKGPIQIKKVLTISIEPLTCHSVRHSSSNLWTAAQPPPFLQDPIPNPAPAPAESHITSTFLLRTNRKKKRLFLQRNLENITSQR
jgi:hypothetical protein